ncbi:Arabinose 5-phosphate isomerase KdsD [Burkholderia cepacia]|nr:Arabinose 5-phosphate isomerase KdsD [Burkholderia cepacia]
MMRQNHIESARQVFEIESRALAGVAARLDANFEQAVEIVLASSGRVVVCGMGKSGIVGRKIAATLSSTGTPAFFMHPGEAYHGDLGMVTPADTFLAISNSGETDEVIKLIPFLRGNGNDLIALTGNPASTLASARGFIWTSVSSARRARCSSHRPRRRRQRSRWAMRWRSR